MRKNYVKRNGQLVQTNKKWSHLKMRQREWIMEITRDEHQKYLEKHQRLPRKQYKLIIVGAVKGKIDEKGIWLSDHELENNISKYIDRLNRRSPLNDKRR